MAAHLLERLLAENVRIQNVRSPRGLSSRRQLESRKCAEHYLGSPVQLGQVPRQPLRQLVPHCLERVLDQPTEAALQTGFDEFGPKLLEADAIDVADEHGREGRDMTRGL